jgi:hypothetical protein
MGYGAGYTLLTIPSSASDPASIGPDPPVPAPLEDELAVVPPVPLEDELAVVPPVPPPVELVLPELLPVELALPELPVELVLPELLDEPLVVALPLLVACAPPAPVPLLLLEPGAPPLPLLDAAPPVAPELAPLDPEPPPWSVDWVGGAEPTQPTTGITIGSHHANGFFRIATAFPPRRE